MADEVAGGSGPVEVNVAPYCVQGLTMMMTLMTLMGIMMVIMGMMTKMMTGPLEVNIAPY